MHKEVDRWTGFVRDGTEPKHQKINGGKTKIFIPINTGNPISFLICEGGSEGTSCHG